MAMVAPQRPLHVSVGLDRPRHALHVITAHWLDPRKWEAPRGAAEIPPLRKIYRAIPDAEGARHGNIRVFDESGEGYLYPKRYFIEVALPRALPKTARKVLA